MKTVEELQVKLSGAEFEVSRALAMIDTHKQQFCMGEDLQRGMLFRDNLRLHCAQLELSKIKKAIRKIEIVDPKATQKHAKNKEPTPEQAIQLRQLKLDAQALYNQDASLARLAKIELAKINVKHQDAREKMLVQKMRDIVGEETFLRICAELSASEATK